MTAARWGSAPIKPMSQTFSPAWSASSPGDLKGTQVTGTPSEAAISLAMSGATPTGSDFSLRPVTSRKLERLMPARRTPVGASSARALSDMAPVYTDLLGRQRHEDHRRHAHALRLGRHPAHAIRPAQQVRGLERARP